MTDETLHVPQRSDYSRYELVALARGQRVLYYREFGSYQGEWLLLAVDATLFYLYKGWYGSCAGCDDFESTVDYEAPTHNTLRAFVERYPPFSEMKHDVARELIDADALLVALPANLRTQLDHVDSEQLARELQTLIKLELAMPITLDDVRRTRNAETKRRALESIGAETFFQQAGVTMLAIDQHGVLLRDEHDDDRPVYVYVKDASTARRYLLRVPPHMRTAREAVAWTFDVPPTRYKPKKET